MGEATIQDYIRALLFVPLLGLSVYFLQDLHGRMKDMEKEVREIRIAVERMEAEQTERERLRRAETVRMTAQDVK